LIKRNRQTVLTKYEEINDGIFVLFIDMPLGKISDIWSTQNNRKMAVINFQAL
jgi:hypothetical protein